MKKAVVILITIILCISLMSACSQEKSGGVFGRVLTMEEDGLIVEMPDLEEAHYVYVKCDYSHLEMRTLYTVVIDFDEADLHPQEGEFIDPFDQTFSYTHVLDKVKNIRLADTAAGEPTFG